MRVFVAGATGVLGRPLVRALAAAGHEVTGTTRSPDRLALVEADGGQGVVCDALDATAVHAAVTGARPEVVVHQLTALPPRVAQMRRGSPDTDRLRTEGTRHLLDAARAAGTRRLIAESIAMVYAPVGPSVVGEDAPVQTDAPGPLGVTLRAVAELERTVTSADGIEGVALRYGSLYGPGTWYARDGDLATQIRKRRMPIVGGGGGLSSFLHVDDAAAATVLALDNGAPGIYNVADDAPTSYAEYLPVLASLLGARPPLRVPGWLLRPVLGAVALNGLTAQRGAANAKVRRELGWTPAYASWRDGFAAEYA